MRRKFAILLLALAALRLGAQTTAAPAAAPTPSAPPAATASPAAGFQLVTPSTKLEISALPDPRDPHSWMWAYQLPGFDENNYQTAVNALLADYERRLGRKLVPGPKRRAGLKVMTNTAGLATPPALVHALITALEARGFQPDELFIADQNEDRLHAAGFLPLDAPEGEGRFDGVQVIAFDRGRYYSPKYNYPSNLPAADAGEQLADQKKYEWKFAPDPRWSLLPVPLLLDVDFWINLPVGTDGGDFGLEGALVNASLLAASNTQRFFANPQSGAEAVADIAAVPELVRGWVLTFLPLEHFQFIGGPRFNSLYTDSLPLLLMSPNPVMLDRMLYDDMSEARLRNHLPYFAPPLYLDYARLPATHLGDDDPKKMYLVQLP